MYLLVLLLLDMRPTISMYLVYLFFVHCRHNDLSKVRAIIISNTPKAVVNRQTRFFLTIPLYKQLMDKTNTVWQLLKRNTNLKIIKTMFLCCYKTVTILYLQRKFIDQEHTIWFISVVLRPCKQYHSSSSSAKQVTMCYLPIQKKKTKKTAFI